MSVLHRFVAQDLCGAMAWLPGNAFFCEPLAYQFMWRALMTSVIVGVICGVLGCFIILRRMALMGDAISHAVLPGVAGAYILNISFFWGAVVTGVLTAVGISYVAQNSRVKEDSAMGILFTGAFALGLVIISMIRAHIDLHHILFGNVLGVRMSDVYSTAAIGLVVLGIILLLYKAWVLVIFDRVMALSLGLPVQWLEHLLMFLLALTVVAALQTVGIVLVVAMLITPGATAHLLTDRLPTMLGLAAFFGTVSSVTGVFLSYHINASSGGTIVLVAMCFFALAFFFAPGRGMVSRWLRRRQRAALQAAA